MSIRDLSHLENINYLTLEDYWTTTTISCLVERLQNSNSRYLSTSRDRPKSAPYRRLKNSKKTSKCQVFSFTVLENRNFFEKNYILNKKDRVARRGPLARAPGALFRADLFVITSSNNKVFTPALIVSRNHNDNVQSTRKFLDDLVGPIQRQKHF